MMKNLLHSPWLTVFLAIVIMTIGYTIYLVQNGNIAQASYYCPAKQICDEGKCAEEGMCSHAECTHCPHCKV
ncbi:hypothetical protein H6770_02925 [Candidatus Peribacteria bacterium]|nr:hypothetical protein [Candidatus Peribacteria bacterium]